MLLFQIHFLYDINSYSTSLFGTVVIFVAHNSTLPSTLCKGLITVKLILMFEDIMVPSY